VLRNKNCIFLDCQVVLYLLFLSLPNIAVGDTFERSHSEICTGNQFLEVYVPHGTTEIKSPPSRNSSEEVQGVTVTVSGFCISQNEISVGDYQPCVLENACSPLRNSQANPHYPVHSITYDEIYQFLVWLNDTSHFEYRLPSESEWQLAALGGVEDRFPWRTVGRLPEVNVFSGILDPVGENSINEFGVRDAVGNLSEFVAGCFTREIGRIPNDGTPYEEDNCGYRLTKGGHYSAPDFFLSPYFRAPIPADFGSPQIGFRIVRSIKLESRHD